METRTSSSALVEPASAPILTISWGAVIAGLAVGLGVHLLFMLMGAAAGLAVYGAGERPDGDTVSLAAAAWNGISMLISALVGGYVAARACGQRRTSDGVLHAVASWGVTMLFYALLTTSVAGNALSGAFGMAANGLVAGRENVSDLVSRFERGDRSGAARILQDSFGLSADQANRLAERGAGVARSTQPGTSEAARSEEAVNEAARTGSKASTWLALVILLSLGAGAGGGVMGAHANVRRSQGGEAVTRRRVIRRHTQGVPSAG